MTASAFVGLAPAPCESQPPQRSSSGRASLIPALAWVPRPAKSSRCRSSLNLHDGVSGTFVEISGLARAHLMSMQYPCACSTNPG